MSLDKILQKQIANAFTNTLGKGGLTEEITIKYVTGDGEYDVENDTYAPQTDDVPVKDAMVTSPTFDDLEKHGVLSSDAKILVPGAFIDREPQADTDKVIRANGEEWDIRKTKGVPGGSLYVLFIYRT